MNPKHILSKELIEGNRYTNRKRLVMTISAEKNALLTILNIIFSFKRHDPDNKTLPILLKNDQVNLSSWYKPVIDKCIVNHPL